MKKRLILLACLLLCASMLAGCSTAGLSLQGAISTRVPGTNPALPEAEAPDALSTRETATLFFRYLSEPYLAAETRIITHSPSQPYELALITELLSGPGSHTTDLTSLFPTGTQVLSTVSQGRTLFVTLSKEIMNPYPDDGSSSPAERTLRRQLCMQSLVATVTENCDFDQVQVLVEQTDGAAGSLRLQKRYFLEDPHSDELVDPLTRQAGMLLTPSASMDVICQLWRSRDWQRLYLYIARYDPSTGMERVSYRDFVTAMENLPMLVDYSLTGGSVSLDGARATYTLDALTLQSGRDTQHQGRTLRLCRENGVWRVTLAQLTGWLEEP